MTGQDNNDQFPQEEGTGDDFGLLNTPEFQQALQQEQTAEQKPKEEDAYDKVTAPSFEPKHNVAAHITRPIISDKQTPAYESMDAPSARAEYSAGMVRGFPNMANDKAGTDAEWAETAMGGMAVLPLNNQFEAALGDPAANWKQGMEDNGSLIYSRIPRLPAVTNAKLSGDSAVQRAISFMGLGDVYGVGMWNSGFWVTFKPAPDTAWLELNRLLGADEIRLGRMTYGLVHSGMTSLTAQTVVNFLLQFVYNTTVNATEMPIADIPKYLSVHDIPNFILGFLAANYPHGYVINRSCLTNPKTCRHTVEQTLEITEAQLVANGRIPTPELRAHMRKRNAGSVSLADVIKYQETLPANTSAVVKLKSGSTKELSMRLAPPTALREFEAGHAHVEEVTTGVQRTVTTDTTIRQRTQMLNEAFSASELRTFEHWIKEIEFDTNTVEGVTDIQSLLEYFTRDHVLRASFYEAVSAYIDQSVVAIPCMTPLVCPNCGGKHQAERNLGPEFSDAIPIDVLQVFSLLAEYKSRLILARLGQN